MLYQTLVVTVWLFLYGDAIIFDGTTDSWMQYTKWNLCPHMEAELTMKLNATSVGGSANGLLVYMDGGPDNSDYLLLQLENGKLWLEYQFGGTEPASYGRDGVQIGRSTLISIERVRMNMLMRIGGNQGAYQFKPNYGADLCFGECLDQLNYRLSPGNSDLYIGGIPPEIESRARSRVSRNLARSFTGDIFDIHLKNCDCYLSMPSVIAKGPAIDTSGDNCFEAAIKAGEGCVCERSSGAPKCPGCEAQSK